MAYEWCPISPMFAPSDPVAPGIMSEDLVRLARVHDTLFAYLSARVPRLCAMRLEKAAASVVPHETQQ